MLDLVGLLDDEVDLHLQRLREGQVTGSALFLVELRLLEVELSEVQLEILAGEVGDRRDLVEQLTQAGGDEPLERFGLGLDEVRKRKDFGDVREVFALRSQRGRHDRIGQGHSELLEEGMEGRGHANG